MTTLFETFLKERRYLKNISPKTETYYRQAWRNWRDRTDGQITKENTLAYIIKLREAGVTPATCNTYISALNAFFTWLHENKHLPEKIKIQKLKAEPPIIQTVPTASLEALLRFKPQTFGQKRMQAILVLLMDTGMRIDCEALSLRRGDFDFDNLLVSVTGKGGRPRIIPFSPECRKVLWQFLKEHDFDLVFPSRKGTKANYRNMIRDYDVVCEKVGIERTGGFHRFRHTFALHYVRNGGGLFHLQKQLGHKTLDMTRRYTELEVEDLKQAHKKTSLLGRLR
ncbi:MAG TPA: tyrosine-type recombinase/integrase [Blastocatellia bacterium]|nr:tyrosine-type recombinase/integrase [Blastocatellia bacterium]